MRHFLLVFWIIILFARFSFAQKSTCTKIPYKENNALYSITFVAPDSGWTCGNNGRILFTPDGGRTWHVQRRKLTESFNDIDFINAQIGYAVGFDWKIWQGIVLNTTDGGQNWQTVLRMNHWIPNAVCVLSNRVCQVVGENGLIFRSNNGGKEWQKIAADKTNDLCLETIYQVDNRIGWVGGSQTDEHGKERGVLYQTTDRGTHWRKVDFKRVSWLQSITFINPHTGFVVGWYDDDTAQKTIAVILKTSDGGKHWTRKKTARIGGRLYAVDFSDSLNGLAVGYDYQNGQGILLQSKDGGETWQSLPNRLANVPYDVVIPDRQWGVIVGSKGMYQLKISAGYGIHVAKIYVPGEKDKH